MLVAGISLVLNAVISISLSLAKTRSNRILESSANNYQQSHLVNLADTSILWCNFLILGTMYGIFSVIKR